MSSKSDDEMFILDAGLMFPEDEMLGVDIVIPDITYVQENKQKLKGIFLSHGHEDSIGAQSRRRQIPMKIKNAEMVFFETSHSIPKKDVLALISDSTEAERRGYNTPENIIEEHILDGFARTRGRIIVSCYASNFVRIQQVLTNAAKTRRKVSFLGRTLESSFKVARNMGYFDIPEGLLVPSHEIGDYPGPSIS